MPADPEQTDRLRELHDEYVWKVNSAVAEGREDLIRRLCDEYVDEAVRVLAADAPAAACGREACEACARPRPTSPLRRRRRSWLELLAAPGAFVRPRKR